MKNVLTDDVISALLDGEVIEKYPDDKPFPSCLVYGRAKDRKPLHVVCALPTHVDILIIVTVYIPLEDEWIDFRRRKAR